MTTHHRDSKPSNLSQRQKAGDLPTKMTRKVAQNIPLVGSHVKDLIFKNECQDKKNIILTYEYLPEITLVCLEQMVYFFIFVAFVLEILTVMYLVWKKKDIEKNFKVSNELKTYIMAQFVLLLVVSSVFFVVSFRVIPLMIQNCKSEMKLAIVRVLNLAIVYYFYSSFIKSIYKKVSEFFTTTQGKLNKVFADERYSELKQVLSKKAKDTQEELLLPLVCSGKKVIPSVREALSDPEVFNIDPVTGKSAALEEAERFCNDGELPKKSGWYSWIPFLN
jgi:hypothetical protein